MIDILWMVRSRFCPAIETPTSKPLRMAMSRPNRKKATTIERNVKVVRTFRRSRFRHRR
jgi:hypothetical protein